MLLYEIIFIVSRNRFMNPFSRTNRCSSDLKISIFRSTKTDYFKVQSSYFKNARITNFSVSEYGTNVYHRNKC